MTTPGHALSDASAPGEMRIARFLDLVQPKLLLVEDELRRSFASRIRTIQDVGDHILLGGGKRLRPALLLLTAQMMNYRGDRDVLYASVVEMIHTASLVHDDIIDEAEVRRGMRSVNYQWGNYLTVLVGDLLYMQAMKRALEEKNLAILDLLSHITIRMIEGEIIGFEQSGKSTLTPDDYFEVVGRKTAGLFGATAQIGGMIVGAEEATCGSLFDYGYNLGVCFQLTDDLLDFTSSTEVLGKPALSDLKEGKLTLPLILAMPQATQSEKDAVARVMTDGGFDAVEAAEILGIVRRYDTVERTREFAREYGEAARRSLAQFGPSPARDALEFAIDFVLFRSF